MQPFEVWRVEIDGFETEVSVVPNVAQFGKSSLDKLRAEGIMVISSLTPVGTGMLLASERNIKVTGPDEVLHVSLVEQIGQLTESGEFKPVEIEKK